MPIARPPLKPCPPVPLSDEEATFIKATIKCWYGKDVVIRSLSADRDRADIHVEAHDLLSDVDICNCIGVLYTRIDRRKGVGLYQTKRGGRVGGAAKIAYRQGVIV